MVIGDRLREMREQKKLSQGDIEKRTGLLRCYLSRVENGHTIPSLDTLAKIAGAMDLALSQFFSEGNSNGHSHSKGKMRGSSPSALLRVRMTSLGQTTAKTTAKAKADPYGMTTKEQATAKSRTTTRTTARATATATADPPPSAKDDN